MSFMQPQVTERMLWVEIDGPCGITAPILASARTDERRKEVANDYSIETYHQVLDLLGVR